MRLRTVNPAKVEQTERLPCLILHEQLIRAARTAPAEPAELHRRIVEIARIEHLERLTDPLGGLRAVGDPDRAVRQLFRGRTVNIDAVDVHRSRFTRVADICLRHRNGRRNERGKLPVR